MQVRRAVSGDIPQIISIYSVDPLTGSREIVSDPLPSSYMRAFDLMARDPNQTLLVIDCEAEVIGTLQLTFIQHLISRGLRRAVVEAFFVHPNHQRSGAGTKLMKHAIEIARDAGCVTIELTSNKARDGAHAFYAGMGFRPSHDGYKLPLKI